ncbi:MAG: beta-N-acetylhexosaminidase [Faecalibacterium sp.]|nr:beta-N-acetylhexosaminidase [Ruminococcus sp.]MCM1391556.1 beta-N-acetylhexosaminidase [Ruminococcus sp.]MCM1485113.1 beta-N-acetylhexosaminidase [Faecalibacterium sp.]
MKFSIVPEPQKINIISDKSVFTLTDFVNINYPDECENAVKNLTDFLGKVFQINPVGTGKEIITFTPDDIIENKEGYRIEVCYDNVHISYGGEAGAFYAVQTLKQLLMQGECSLPQLEIEDYPRIEYRGFMLDTGRYFFSVEAVKLFLDAMAVHKLNRFHWHLTEDQGWRVELYSKILLAQIGGFRAYTNFGRKPHGGFYSKQDIADIIAYAHERYITVIPEIDSPGHIVSAIAAYPELSCFDRELPVATHSGVKHDVLCIGKESTFDFMFAVFDELCEMFPDKIIHIGGDEVPTTRWQLCPHCQKRMKDNGMTSESELHTYYLNRIAEHIRSKGFEVIMWNDNVPSKTSKEIIWQYWDTNIPPEQMAKEINSGRKIINSFQPYYLDLPYGTTNLKQCYEYEPNINGVNEESKKNVLGIEACLWTEYVPTMKKAGYCTFPRLGAFCETAWTNIQNKNYRNFVEKLPLYYKLLDTLPFDRASLKQAMPNPIRKYGYLLYFERRKLHWQGLHNIIDNNKVKRLAKSKEVSK